MQSGHHSLSKPSGILPEYLIHVEVIKESAELFDHKVATGMYVCVCEHVSFSSITVQHCVTIE